MEEERTPRVLSVQSHVVSGYVGNKSATFPLQLLGFEVDNINSVQFSNHTGYAGGIKGSVLNSDQLGDLIDGLKSNNLDHFDFSVSGYIGSVGFLEKLSEVMTDLKKTNPNLVYVCDPVMGDTDQGWYVPKELLTVYKDKILPLANFCVPNQFELELLADMKIKDQADAFKAMQVVHDSGVEVVILSSSDICTETGNLICLASSTLNGPTPLRFSIKFPRLDANFVGTGDLFAALSVAWFNKSSGDLKITLENTIASMQAILKRTLDSAMKRVAPGARPTSGDLELKLVQSQDDILNPRVVFKAQDI